MNIVVPLDGEKYQGYINRILKDRDNVRDKSNYQERHHITPKCLDGTDDDDNLIWLYAQEHYYAHKLLAEENVDNSGLQYAWWNMCQCKRKNRSIKISADEFAKIRERIANIQSKYVSANRKGINNPNYGKHFSEEHKQKIAQSHFGKIRSEEDKKKISEHHANVKGENNPNATKVICLETGEEFNTISSACRWCGLKDRNSIRHYLNGKRGHAGLHPITKEKLHWKIVE